MSGLLLVLLGLLWLLVCVLSRRNRRDNEPPLINGWIPFIGKGVEFGRDAYGFLQQQQKKFGDVFTVYIAGARNSTLSTARSRTLTQAMMSHSHHFLNIQSEDGGGAVFKLGGNHVRISQSGCGVSSYMDTNQKILIRKGSFGKKFHSR